jgi:hypothetical protein
MSKTNNSPAARYEMARQSVKDAEARNMSASTINRRYREMFAAEDALKATAGAWA